MSNNNDREHYVSAILDALERARIPSDAFDTAEPKLSTDELEMMANELEEIDLEIQRLEDEIEDQHDEACTLLSKHIEHLEEEGK